MTKMKMAAVLSLWVLWTSSAWGHDPVVVPVQLDSVQVIVKEDKKFLLHKVLARQTLYTIARAYGLKVNDIYTANPELKERLVKVEEIIKIPLWGMDLIPTVSDEGPKAYYRIEPQETMYRIARVYFNMEIEYLQRLNNLTDHHLDTGQKLLIGTLLIKKDSTLVNGAHPEEREALFKSEDKELTWKEDKSIAYWLKDKDHSHSLFVLHNSAPINSMVEVYNPVFNRSVTAKVVGRIPTKAYTNDIDIILSHGVAEKLGAIDQRLYVRVRYLKTSH